jgi:hypothetical protein
MKRPLLSMVCSKSYFLFKYNKHIFIAFCVVNLIGFFFGQYRCNQNCIGTIDGTHVKVSVKGENIVPYRSRKSTITQNVMCVTDIDLCFTYIYVGWEGSTHDARIFLECIHDPTSRFPMPVEGSIIFIYVYF